MHEAAPPDRGMASDNAVRSGERANRDIPTTPCGADSAETGHAAVRSKRHYGSIPAP